MQSILNYAGLALGIASIVVTVYFAVRYAERKDPCVYVLRDSKVSFSPDAPELLEVRYRDKPIPTLSAAYVWLWNAGRKPIRREDVPTKAPITLLVGDSHFTGEPDPGELLDVKVLRTTRESIGFSVQPADQRVVVEFDFLDHQDGALIEIQHTWRPSVAITAVGTVLGAPKGVRSLESLESFDRYALLFAGERAVKRRNVRQRAAAGAAILLMWGMVWFFWSSRLDIITDRARIGEALTGFVVPERIGSAVYSVDVSSKMRSFNRTAPMILAALTLFASVGMLWELFRPRTQFPRSLIPMHSSRDRNAEQERDEVVSNRGHR